MVFTLLEAIYHSFDEIARRRRVFKVRLLRHAAFLLDPDTNRSLILSGQVETIGDCYVAVAGLPEPRPDHALVMARFARDCLMRLSAVTKQLEIELGPST
jgi:class 3 adenylate cyclase